MNVAAKAIRRTARELPWVRRVALRRRIRHGITGQSDEGLILRRLVEEVGAPKSFVEFGFHPAEFNCASLMHDHEGLLIDGDPKHVADAKHVLPRHIQIEQRFLTLTNLDIVKGTFSSVGVLSIDVDGNDYWFLKELIEIEPAVIAVEYNASFLHQPISVEYDPAFSRFEKHRTGWYHGASLAALAKLVAAHGYGLAAVSDAGGNAFFTRTGNLDPATAWGPSRMRDEHSRKSAQEQWAAVSALPYVYV